MDCLQRGESERSYPYDLVVLSVGGRGLVARSVGAGHEVRVCDQAAGLPDRAV